MKKYVSMILMLVLLASMLASCGEEAEVVDKNNNVVNGEFTEYLVIEKVGTLNVEHFITAEGGIYYKGENDLWGVASFNGAKDTGAIFTDVTPRGKFFEVATVTMAGKNDITTLNKSYLINGDGETIISEYATYDVISDRYVLAAKATDRTDLKDESIVSINDDGKTSYGSYYDTMYRGDWAVYDMTTEKYVPGATGSHYSLVSASGRYISFNDAEKNKVTLNENGEDLPKDAKLFDDGSYSVEGRGGEVFDENGNLMFTYELTGYIPSEISNGYYVAQKRVDGANKYVVMDAKGNVISTEFDAPITFYGNIVYCDNKVYSPEGKCIIEGTYEHIYYDKMFGQNWMLENDDYFTMIDKNGNIFFNGPNDDEHTVFPSDFMSCKKIGDDRYYYSYKDKDYTIEGSSFAPWIVKTYKSDPMLYDLVDTMTGKTLLENYKDYNSISRNSLAYYVYAEYNGGADVYLVVSSAQLEDVIVKKEDLFEDLATEFEKEGIAATINRETGEIALDASVLFGGDSAELTSDGKDFLNKFIKAYASVAFSEKYDGFISKTMIEGHIAPIEGSTYESGLPLSEERALNVKNYCLSADIGIDLSGLGATFEDVGYSNSKPVYDADGGYDLDACRRVSFRFIVDVDF